MVDLSADVKALRQQGDSLFSAKKAFDSRNQDIADHFYVERADFTTKRDIGADYADHLVTGYPCMVRRDLGNSLGSMLRPKAKQWFRIGTDRPEKEDHEAKMWLDWATGTQRRAMYDPKSMFTRATKEGDHDFATFGGAVISTEVNRRDMTLLYRCWHLKDVAWTEDSYGQICAIHRNWQPTAREACNYRFKNGVHSDWLKKKERDPECEVHIRHVVIRSDEYDWANKRFPWVSVYIDLDNNHLLEEVGSWTRIYTLPRWATVSGSAYPYSPATVIALPDARLLQAMTLTLLDAGERAADPPMIGVSEAIRGDLNLYPGGFTAIDAEYDERLGEVLRPLVGDHRMLPFGVDMADRTSAQLREAFYLNTLSMPPHEGPEMTAFEVGQRVQEYIRNALPLFEPMEDEYNSALCDITFETLMHNGGFGPIDSIPEQIRGADTQYQFESPLSDMIEREKGAKFLEAKSMIAEAAAVDPPSVAIMNFGETLRDVLTGIGAPPKWLNSPEDVDALRKREAQQIEGAALMDNIQKGAGATADLAAAAQQMQVSGV